MGDPGTLIMLGDYYGSLCAARTLGAAGCPVWYADHRRLVPGLWSRHVTRRLSSPPISGVERYTDWLLETGRRHPGMFLYPVSDDHVWIIGSHRAEFEKVFRLFQPPREATYALLNKERLLRKALELGVPAPKTWFPTSDAELRTLAPTLAYPVLIKPRTQMCFLSKTKGLLCRSADELIEAFPRFRADNLYSRSILEFDAEVEWPMVQEYLADAMTDGMSVAGFVGEGGTRFAFRSSRKVFQRPRRLGIGVAFEALATPEDLAGHVLALCRAVGYFGAFEVEFIKDSAGRLLLTDFNPRYYGQMAFEVARGLPLPLLVWHGAFQRSQEVTRIIDAAHALDGSALATRSVYAQSWILRLLLVTQLVAGRMSFEEFSRWRRWLKHRDRERFDALVFAGDPAPLWVDIVGTLMHFARHPRDFVRKFFLDT